MLLLLVTVVFSFVSRASAAPEDPASRVILLIAAPQDPTCERIGAELAALGYDVKTIQERRSASAPVGLDELELLSRTVDAAATIGVDLGTGETRVWTMGRTSGRITLRVVLPLEGEPAVAAMRAVEALRTLLNRPDERATQPSPPVLPAPAPVASDASGHDTAPGSGEPRSAAAAIPLASLAVGPALAVSRGSFSPSWQGVMGLHWLFGQRLGIEILGVVPVTGGKWQESEGSASLTLAIAAAGLHFRALAWRWGVVDMGAGLGAAWLHAQSSPGPGFAGRTNDTVVASPFARLGYAVPFARLIWLRADVAMFVTLPRPVFTVAERALSSGWPTPVASVGVEVALR
ncbi:MAG: hypothetical protein M3O50_19140 [Myxococcota bacterium]|nr:hypothetical protein [Myxococcota bacterium]